MSEGHSPVEAAILAVPESTASVVYGMYDLFMSAGRDWNVIVEGKPGRTLIRPRIASRQGGPFQAANDVPITPHVTLEQCVAPAGVCVPEVAIPPGQSFVRRPLHRRTRLAAALLQRGRYARHRLLRGHAAGGSRPAGRPRSHYPLGVLRSPRRAPPQGKSTGAASARHFWQRAAPRDGGWR